MEKIKDLKEKLKLNDIDSNYLILHRSESSMLLKYIEFLENIIKESVNEEDTKNTYINIDSLSI